MIDMHLMSNASRLELFVFEIGYEMVCLTILNKILELEGHLFHSASHNGC